LEDVAKIDPNLGETLLRLKEIVNKKQEIERDSNLNPIEKSERIKELKFKVRFNFSHFIIRFLGSKY